MCSSDLGIMAEFKFEIVEKVGVISEKASGWAKELNFVSWNGAEPKFDIREWDPNHEKMGKGITFTVDELKALKELIDSALE